MTRTTRQLPIAALTVLALAGAPAAKLPAQDNENGSQSTSATGSGPDDAAQPEREAELLSGTRQLTFEGRRAGEGYFGPEGRRLIFQSERQEDNPFFQIYLMDLETGDVERLSPGHGKTTCAWLHPDGERALFASTHEDPEARQKQAAELERRASGKQRRYEWDYDEHFEIYEVDLETRAYHNLTQTVGYDAEGSYSPDGQWIAFASNRQAYARELADDEGERFEIDPSYFMEIYIMKSDGSDVRRLTRTPGYDGGPFFSPDGERICWRRFSEDGARAEIFTMRTDGSDERQLTHLGVMSWAPFYHPSGDYLIFTTNRHGFSNFELYLVDAAGARSPVRVTYTPGFDGLPVFRPAGDELYWTSNRTANGRSQIFAARFDDQAARARLAAAPPVAPGERDEAVTSPGEIVATQAPIRPVDLQRHVEVLASEAMEGRLTGTEGERKATAYVAEQFRRLGLEPAGDVASWLGGPDDEAASYFQPFPFTAGIDLGEDNRLTLVADGGEDVRFEVDEDWRPLASSAEGDVDAADVVFAGYGIVAPASDEHEAYDSFTHLDVEGKWVLALRYLPEDVSQERRQHLSRYASLRYKTMIARDRGAHGLLVASGPRSKVRSQLVKLGFDAAMAGSSLPVVSVTDAVATRLLEAGGSKKSLEELQASLDTGEPQMGFGLKEVRLAAHIDLEKVRKSGRNVLARLRRDGGADVHPRPVVLVGAHVDHLGRGGSGSMAREDEEGAIHRGADDNASGVAALLEMAEYLVSLKNEGRLELERDIVFAAWSGEELGLLGSKHFVDELEKELAHALGTAHAPGGGKASHDHGKHAHGDAHGDAHGEAKARPTAPGARGETPVGETSGKKVAKQGDDESAHAKGHPHAGEKPPHGDAPHARGHQHTPHGETHADGSGEAHASSLRLLVAACLNLDMVGRLDKKLTLQGVGSSSVWRREIERRNAPIGLPLSLSEDSYLPTDATSFYLKGVPILSAFTGTHGQYHTPRDTPELLNYDGAARVARFMALVARGLATSGQTPDYVRQKRPEQSERRAGLRVYLGTIPDYGESPVKGVLLSGVAKGGPAETAGVRGGDVIVELAGRKIENIYDYTYAIDALKIEEEAKITVLRGPEKKQRVTLKIVPGSRD